MTHDLTRFATRRCREQRLLAGGEPVSATATTLFVDLAGFTPLTERMARLGTRGTETLSATLRSFFGAATDVVLRAEGDPVAYGGDALTVIFDAPAQSGLAAARESAAAIVGLAEEVDLQVKVGIARGEVVTAVAHSSRRSIPIHLGGGLDLAVAAEESAAPGHVVVHDTADRDDGAGEPSDSRLRGTAEIDSDQLTRLVHPTFLDRLRDGGDLLESHRTVSVAFVRFPPVPPDALPAFARTVGALLELVDASDGEVVQVSGGDKGVVAMSVFGAPVAHDDDGLRAVDMLLELRRIERAAAAGVATGAVFTAVVGTEERAFLMNSGSAVNLAARLMQASSPGAILVDPATWGASASHLRASRPAARHVKGRDGPVEVRAVHALRRTRRRTPAAREHVLVGRKRELAAIEALLDGLASGATRHVQLAGPAGIGKTRLVREALVRARTRGVAVTVVDFDDHARGRASHLWRDLVRELCGIPPRAGRRQWAEQLSARLTEDAQRHALERLLGLGPPVSGATSELPMEVEAELAAQAMMTLTEIATSGSLHLLVVENADDLDPVSATVLARLRMGPVGAGLGLLETRLEPSATSTPAPGSMIVRIDALPAADAALVAGHEWRRRGGGAAPQWLASAVVHRAGGNPLLLQLVTGFLLDRWQPGQPPPRDDIAAMPQAALLAQQLDQVPARSLRLLHVLAVMRRPCSRDLVVGVLPGYFDTDGVAAAAAQLADAGLIAVDDTGDDERYRLAHEVMRAVVYEAMSYAERSQLHGRLAEYLGSKDADPVEVAEHVHSTDPMDEDAARHWFPRAAAAARRSWALPEAIAWWRRALPLLDGEARDEGRCDLAEVLLVGGRPQEVLALLDEPDTASPPGVRVRWAHAEAEAALVCGDLDRCQAAAAEVMQWTSDTDEVRHQRAAELIVRSLSERGDTAGARAAAHAQLRRAEHGRDLRAITTAHASLGLALFHSGEVKAAAEHHEKAWEGAVETGDVVQEVHSLSDLAGCRYELGEYDSCLRLLSRARVSAEAIGYRRHLAMSLTNEAQLRCGLGDQYATACAAMAVRSSLEHGDLGTAANAVHAWITADPGFSAAARHWERLVRIDHRLGRRAAAAEGLAWQALAEARAGRTARARQVAAAAAEASRELELPWVRRRAALAEVWVAAGHRDLEAALSRLADLQSADDLDELERAELALDRWRLSRAEPDRRRAVEHLQAAFAVEPAAWVQDALLEVEAKPPGEAPSLPPPVGIARAGTTRTQLVEALATLEEAAAGASVLD